MSSVEIHALNTKLEIVAEVAYRLKRSEGPSLRQLAIAIGVDPTTLSKAAARGTLTPGLEKALADIAGFDPSHLAWTDPTIDPRDRSVDPEDYKGSDTVDACRRFLFGLHEMDPNVRRKFDDTEPPEHPEPRVATFLLEGNRQVVDPNQGLDLFFRSHVRPIYHDNFVYGFSRVWLRFIKPAKSKIRMARRLGENAPYLINGAMLEARGSEADPEWRLSVVGGQMIDGEFRIVEEPLCKAMGVKIGDVVTAEFYAQTRDGSIVDGDGKPMRDLDRAAVLGILSSMELAQSLDNRGWVTLGTQRLVVTRGDF